MDLSDPAQRQAWIDDLGTVFAGRRVIAGIAPLAGLVDLVPLTRDAGADGLMFVANGTGAGPVPSPDDGRVVLVEVERYPTMTEELRAHDHLARHLPDAVRAAVDDLRPGRQGGVAGRPVRGQRADRSAATWCGGRRRSWIALEDKIVAEEIWAAVGAAQSPYRVVPADRPDLLDEASAALDPGSGTVWSGDARDGFNGGGDFVRWVADAAEREAALAFFAPRCDRVRVMPFLEGVPCSIHGMRAARRYGGVPPRRARDPARRRTPRSCTAARAPPGTRPTGTVRRCATWSAAPASTCASAPTTAAPSASTG